jgi:hypothetical protein
MLLSRRHGFGVCSVDNPGRDGRYSCSGGRRRIAGSIGQADTKECSYRASIDRRRRANKLPGEFFAAPAGRGAANDRACGRSGRGASPPCPSQGHQRPPGQRAGVCNGSRGLTSAEYIATSQGVTFKATTGQRASGFIPEERNCRGSGFTPEDSRQQLANEPRGLSPRKGTANEVIDGRRVVAQRSPAGSTAARRDKPGGSLWCGERLVVVW